MKNIKNRTMKESQSFSHWSSLSRGERGEKGGWSRHSLPDPSDTSGRGFLFFVPSNPELEIVSKQNDDVTHSPPPFPIQVARRNFERQFPSCSLFFLLSALSLFVSCPFYVSVVSCPFSCPLYLSLFLVLSLSVLFLVLSLVRFIYFCFLSFLCLCCFLSFLLSALSIFVSCPFSVCVVSCPFSCLFCFLSFLYSLFFDLFHLL